MYVTSILLMAVTTAVAIPVADLTAREPATNVARQQVAPTSWTGYCFGAEMNHADTDTSHDELRNWAAGNPRITTTDHNIAEVFVVNDVFWYACVDHHNNSLTFSQADVDAAAIAMDQACPRYTSSYALMYYDETVGPYATPKIIGKDVEGHPICQNSEGDGGYKRHVF